MQDEAKTRKTLHSKELLQDEKKSQHFISPVTIRHTQPLENFVWMGAWVLSGALNSICATSTAMKRDWIQWD